MANAPAFVSALDALLNQRERQYTRDMNFATALQNAKMAVERENTIRAQLNASIAINSSQEQRARDNQSMANYRNALSAPLEGARASRAAYLQQQQPAQDALRTQTLLANARMGLKNALLNEAIRDQDTSKIRELTGYYARVINNRIMISPTATGAYRDIRTNELEAAMNQRESIAASAGDAQESYLDRLLAKADEPAPAVAASAAPAVAAPQSASAASPVAPFPPQGVPTRTPATAVIDPFPPQEIPMSPSQHTIPLDRPTIKARIKEQYMQPVYDREAIAELEAKLAALGPE